ncbi:LIRP-like [Aedes albopictus]|uniref:Insulin-like domain-containing protein n=1 Tax=Aedes albopictus TaxID=7160 RepID=A0ABM1ZZ56_AEDAL|nr:LIRP-like isoform X1 [Aedes albopictus]KXJ69526.1 hypothetical protein RP20_CCG026703 [Aedes albopictus]
MASHPRRSTFSAIFILCCALLLLIVLVEVGGNRVSTVERNSTETQLHRVSRDRRHYCGKALTDTLALVCNSYPSPWRKKSGFATNDKSYEGSYREQLIEEIKQDLEELEQLAPEVFDDQPAVPQALQFHPFYPRSYQPEPPMPMMMEGGSYRRVRRQIVDECCRKSCTLKTLKQYCAD